MTILVTGGFGFIGSEFVRRAVARGEDVVNVDVETYAADPRRCAEVAAALRSFSVDVAAPAFVELVKEVGPSKIVHFAAESHVTRSEDRGDVFFRTNVEGTERVVEAARAAGVDLLVHVSTDEIYGPCPGEPFNEDQKLPGEGAATSAYARSKAVADDVVRAAFDNVPAVVVRPTNCFGPWQHPEKAIPRWTIRALSGEPIPVWGDGRYVRDWMVVQDLCSAIELLMDRSVTSDVFNVAPEGSQIINLDIARAIARAAGRDETAVVLTEYDRPQHDRRYAVDASKIRKLGWRPIFDLDRALEETVDWYRGNPQWWEPLRAEAESIYSDAPEATL
ncbi:MAG: NAD-dependent epimerase/dehydratase family protein [Actinomycetota bacterium]|nr:NAD-dependent epimerase/dehydratase family protein [Actinomycetota bacterium]